MNLIKGDGDMLSVTDDWKEKIFRYLTKFCKQEKIKVQVSKDLPLHIMGHLRYTTNSFGIANPIIEIREDKYCLVLPWVFAHEVGHYIAVSKNNDTSEKGADIEAKKLCESILGEEYESHSKVLDTIFNSN